MSSHHNTAGADLQACNHLSLEPPNKPSDFGGNAGGIFRWQEAENGAEKRACNTATVECRGNGTKRRESFGGISERRAI